MHSVRRAKTSLEDRAIKRIEGSAVNNQIEAGSLKTSQQFAVNPLNEGKRKIMNILKKDDNRVGRWSRDLVE